MQPAPLPEAMSDELYARDVVLLAFASLAELRESDTESHLLRVQGYVQALTRHLQAQAIFSDQLTPALAEQMWRSVVLYDIGTVAIPERILLKPGRLSADEQAIMRTPTSLGFAAIVRAEKALGRSSSLLTVAKELTLSHHEKWDGSGYPQGLAGTQIPLSARIVALADVYDALITHKVYKDGISHEHAVRLIAGERGAHFDPQVVDAFIAIQDEFAAIAQRFADTEEDMQQKMEYMANAIAEHAEPAAPL